MELNTIKLNDLVDYEVKKIMNWPVDLDKSIKLSVFRANPNNLKNPIWMRAMYLMQDIGNSIISMTEKNSRMYDSTLTNLAYKTTLIKRANIFCDSLDQNMEYTPDILLLFNNFLDSIPQHIESSKKNITKDILIEIGYWDVLHGENVEQMLKIFICKKYAMAFNLSS
jgi:hypothetical protein